MKIGDIHWIQLPATNRHEQAGHRPAMSCALYSSMQFLMVALMSTRHTKIVQDETYAGNLPVVLVVPLTTVSSALRFAGTFLINPTASNGLKQASVVLVFQLRSVDRSRIEDKIGTVSDEVMLKIFATLDKLIGRLKLPS